jgi:hypothetical protein
VRPVRLSAKGVHYVSEAPRYDRSRSAAKRREELGYRSRLERRTAKRVVRRRKVSVKMWRAIVPVAALIAIIVVLLIAFGGGGGNEPAQGTATTLATAPKEGSGLLVLEQEGGVPEVLLMQPTGGSGVVMAMPGVTLLKTSAGFKTIAELHDSGESGALQAALADAFGVSVGVVATARWTELREAMLSAGLADVPAVALSLVGAEAESVAQVALAFLGTAVSQEGATVWDSLSLDGDAAGFRAAVAANAESLPDGWTAVALTGSLVEGRGFQYLEPDAEQARALLGGETRESTIAVEVQNGSGAIGAAEAAAEILQALGYTLLPVSNSEDFPDVIETRITVAPDLAADGEQVRAALGVGQVSESEDLDPGTIVVVLGADFVPPSTSGTD